jgi:hypothetical protein
LFAHDKNLQKQKFRVQTVCFARLRFSTIRKTSGPALAAFKPAEPPAERQAAPAKTRFAADPLCPGKAPQPRTKGQPQAAGAEAARPAQPPHLRTKSGKARFAFF